jgi:hypothetical protein
VVRDEDSLLRNFFTEGIGVGSSGGGGGIISVWVSVIGFALLKQQKQKARHKLIIW